MYDEAARLSLLFFFMRLLVHEVSFSSEITVQSAIELRASKTKTRKKKLLQSNQIAVNRLVFVTYFFMFFSWYFCLFSPFYTLPTVCNL